MTQFHDLPPVVGTTEPTKLNRLLGHVGLGYGDEFRRLSADCGVPITPLRGGLFLLSSVKKEVVAELERKQYTH